MSRDYDDDDEPRPRRRRPRYDEDDDYDRPRRRRGGGSKAGSVTGVGVISIILGSLLLLCGLCVTLGGVAAGAGGAGMRGPGMFPAQMAAGILIFIAIGILVLGALYLAGGIGCLQRRQWGRIMTLIMAGFSGLLGVLQIINVIVTIAQTSRAAPIVMGGPPGFQEGFQAGQVVGIIIGILLVLVLFTHCIMSFVVLLNAANAAEFD
jgi:hypothetical protein